MVGTLFNKGQRPSTPPPIDNDGDITLDPQTPKPKRTNKGKGRADPPAGPGPSRSGHASNAPPQGSRPSGPRPLPNPPVAPRQQPKKPEVQFARVGPPPPINKATKPRKSYASTLGQGPKRPVTIAQVAKVMPQLPLECAQVLIGFGTGSDITCEFDLFICRARVALQDGGSSLQVLSMEFAYTGYALHTDGVASEKDLEFI
ncbi:hypothetical protein CPC08DRAFT_771332 [Agrocybe pediades]|nr:hypothetical protein CPC08DRAFT_771332 [Agrocybe pediades]